MTFDLWPLLLQVKGPLDHSHFDMFPPEQEEPPDELSGWDKDFWRTEGERERNGERTKTVHTRDIRYWIKMLKLRQRQTDRRESCYRETDRDTGLSNTGQLVWPVPLCLDGYGAFPQALSRNTRPCKSWDKRTGISGMMNHNCCFTSQTLTPAPLEQASNWSEQSRTKSIRPDKYKKKKHLFSMTLGWGLVSWFNPKENFFSEVLHFTGPWSSWENNLLIQVLLSENSHRKTFSTGVVPHNSHRTVTRPEDLASSQHLMQGFYFSVCTCPFSYASLRTMTWLQPITDSK